MPPIGLPGLPSFRNGAYASAEALNSISQNQAYIYQASARVNMPFEWMTRDDLRYVVHRSRYLHWKVTSATGATLELNGIAADTADATSGYVDLQVYGMANNQVYTAEWTGATVECKRLYESPSTTGLLTLPAASPTFVSGDTATADQLNAVSDDTEYLLNNGILLPNMGYVGRTYYGNKPEKKLDYTMIHRQRYLFFTGTMRHGGTPDDDDMGIAIKVNDTPIWHVSLDGRNATGGRYKQFDLFYDLEGTDHEMGGYTVSGLGDTGVIDIADGSTLGLSPYEEYWLRLHITTDTSQCEATIFQAAEYPWKSIW